MKKDGEYKVRFVKIDNRNTEEIREITGKNSKNFFYDNNNDFYYKEEDLLFREVVDKKLLKKLRKSFKYDNNNLVFLLVDGVGVANYKII